MTGDPYFYTRAEAELRLAQSAGDPAAMRIHYELANRYLDRFYHPGETGTRRPLHPVPLAEEEPGLGAARAEGGAQDPPIAG